MGAMPEEIALLDQQMLNKSAVEIARRTFHTGNLFGVDCVAVIARVGKVAAAITATLLIERWQVDAIIFVGCAGAIDSKLNVGDIVVAEQLIQHDLDGSPLWPKYTAPLLEMAAFATDPTLRRHAVQAASRFLETDFLAIDAAVRHQFGISQPQLFTGLIASGDQFIHSPNKREQLQKDLPGLLCVEMEGGAIAQVCYEHGVPFTVIRTISDNANGSAHIDFNAFNSAVVCHYSRGIIYHLLSAV
jgi:adenosylhomocysteine nucleosidase